MGNPDGDFLGTRAQRAELAEAAGLCLVLFVAILLRIDLLLLRSLWVDEAVSLEIAARRAADIVKNSALAEPHPPGYYLLLRAWQALVGPGIVASRTLSLPFGVATVVLTWLLGRRLWGRAVGLLSGAMISLNPFQIFASGEVRMYAVLTFTGLLATALLIRAVEGRLARRWVLYGLAAAVVSYTSYYGSFLLLSHAVWLLRYVRDRSVWRGVGLAVATWLLCYGPWIPSLRTSLTSNPLPWRPAPTVRYAGEFLAIQTAGGHVWGTAGYLGSPSGTGAWRGWAVAAPFLLLARYGVSSGAREGAGALVASSWAVPVVAALGGSWVWGRVLGYGYHVAFVQPYMALLVAAGVAQLGRRLNGRAGAGVLAVASIGVLAVVGIGAARAVGSQEYAFYRFDLVARLIQRERASKRALIFYNAHGFQAVTKYVEPKALEPYIVIHADPRAWTKEAVAEGVREAVRTVGPGRERVLLIVTLPVPEGSMEELLEGLRKQGYGIASVWDFRGVLVAAMEGRGRSRKTSGADSCQGWLRAARDWEVRCWVKWAAGPRGWR